MSAATEISTLLPFETPANLELAADRLASITPFFKSYLDKKKLVGFSTLIARGGKIAHFECGGATSLEEGQKVDQDTIFRIYSMTKPITSVALMMLFEKGLFRLDNPVEKFLPEFKDIQVWDGRQQSASAHATGIASGQGSRSAHPYEWADLWLYAQPSG